jgi:hypothetical protein
MNVNLIIVYRNGRLHHGFNYFIYKSFCRTRLLTVHLQRMVCIPFCWLFISIWFSLQLSVHPASNSDLAMCNPTPAAAVRSGILPLTIAVTSPCTLHIRIHPKRKWILMDWDLVNGVAKHVFILQMEPAHLWVSKVSRQWARRPGAGVRFEVNVSDFSVLHSI